MAGGRSKLSSTKEHKNDRPNIGTGLAEGAAKTIETTQKTKQQRLDEIMGVIRTPKKKK